MEEKNKQQGEKIEQIFQMMTLVAGRFSLQEVLDRLAEAAVKITGLKACSIRLLDEEAGELKMRSTYGLSEEYRNKGPVTKDDPVIKAAFAGQAIVVDDMRVDERTRYREATLKEGLVSQLTVAMNFREKAVGVLRLYSPEPKQYNDEEIAIARTVASQCAVAITNARLYAEAIEGARIAEQMRVAGDVQRRMIPEKAPQIDGIEISALYIPCYDIGGDFYDMFRISENRIAVAISDVIGKGIPAALMMGQFRGAMRAYTDSEFRTGGISAIVSKLNKMACGECKDGEFISLFYGVIDAEKKTMTYCNCGHEPTILIRAGKVIDLQTGGLVLGVDAGAEYRFETIDLKKGDSLIFYTDGLIDAANYEGQLWGRENLVEAAKKFRKESAEQMIKDIIGYRRRFVGLVRQLDDTSVIAVKVKE